MFIHIVLVFNLKQKSLTKVAVHLNKNSEYLQPDYFDGIVCSYTNAQSLLAIILVIVREKSPAKS